MKSINHTVDLKGIHPGLIVARKLKKMNMGKSQFALSIGEYPQTFSAITLGKRDMNTKLALKIEKALRYKEGYLMELQVYYDIEKEKQKLYKPTPDLKKIRRVLFWDTTFDRIDWDKHKRAVIERVFERGNEEEKEEIIRFYGKATIDKIIQCS